MNGIGATLIFAAGAAAMLAEPGPPLSDAVAGSYSIQQIEMAGGLELGEDGRFRYALSYGAADEVAEGDWILDGDVVRLTSNPMPRAPLFEIVADQATDPCRLNVNVDWGKLQWNGSPDVFVGYVGDAEVQYAPVDENGDVRLRQCAVDTIVLLVPVYGTPTRAIRLTPTTGHLLQLRFVPNDLGRAAFNNERLKREGSDLLMNRYDSKIRFVRNRL